MGLMDEVKRRHPNWPYRYPPHSIIVKGRARIEFAPEALYDAGIMCIDELFYQLSQMEPGVERITLENRLRNWGFEWELGEDGYVKSVTLKK